jgi:co-chaperonin GroES (HSP10)
MKKIKNVKPAAYSILVEMLSEKELTNSALILSNIDKDSNQGYIVGVGPLVDKKSGFKNGQRVILQGKYNPVPNPTDSGRVWGVVQIHDIKAILEEVEA